MMKVKYYKCPADSMKFKTLSGWGKHVESNHPEMIPEGYSISRYFYLTKTGKTHGSCLSCKGDTAWDEASMKYKRYCGNPQCITDYVQIAKGRMIGKHGQVHLLNSPNMQRKMAAGRKISGEYAFMNGVSIPYVGSYERNFLHMLNTMMSWSSDNIIAPSPHTYYYEYTNLVDKENEGMKFYIPDFYIPSLNLEIEIKQTTTTHPKIIAIDKVKELQKDAVMKSNPNVNYIKIVDNDYSNFFELLLDLKESIPTDADLKNPIATVTPLSEKEKEELSAMESSMETSVSESPPVTSITNYDNLGLWNINDDMNKDSAYCAGKEPFPSDIGSFDKNKLWNPIVKINGENYRERCECLIFKDGKLFSSVIDENNCRIPGGGTMNDRPISKQCQREVEEEAFICVDNLEYIGSFIKAYPGQSKPKWVIEQIPKEMQWVGQYCHVYVAQYVSKYTGNVPEIDKDYNMANNGAFYDLSEIKPKLYPEIQTMLDNYLKIQNVLTDSLEVAQEGLFDFLKRKVNPIDELVSSWKYNLFGKDTSLKDITSTIFSGVKIRDGMIEIHGIKYSTLANRIRNYYQDKSIENIFVKKYDALSYKKYLRKRIAKSEVKIDYLYVPEFFALELVNLFDTLYKRYRDKAYKNIATEIYRVSWIGKADTLQGETKILDTAPLSKLTLDLTTYQIEFIQRYPKLKAYLNLNGYILAFVQGLGKTLTSIGLAECLKKDRIYIVCPNTLKENWALEIKKYYDKYQDRAIWSEEVFICSDKEEKFIPDKVRFIITNNESISKMFPYVLEGDNMLILDESHNFRNLQGKRVNDLIDLRDKLQCKDVLVMSGTPIKAAPAEIVPALMLIDPSFTLEAAKIYSKAFKLDNSLGTSIVQARFGKIMYRKEKDELPNLPEKFIGSKEVMIKNPERFLMSYVKELIVKRFGELYQEALVESDVLRKRFLEMVKLYSRSSDEDKSKYTNWVIKSVNTNRSMALHEIDQEFMNTYLEKHVKPYITNKEAYNELVDLEKRFIKMERHCMGVALGEILPKYRRDMFIAMYEENKEEFYRDINDSEKKTVIFSQFRDVVDYIADDLNKNDILTVKISGLVASKDRMTNLEQFKEDDMTRVLVATSQTLGTGVTLVEANQMFFFGPPWRSTDFDQCSDRIHRIGQTVPVHIYSILLNTGTNQNLSTRMDSILQWSKEMFDSTISKTDDSDWDNDIATAITTEAYSLVDSLLINANFFFDDIRKAFVDIETLFYKLSKFKYGFMFNQRFISAYYNFENFCKTMRESYVTMDMADFKRLKTGICWDYAQYQTMILKKKNIQCQNYYIELDNEQHSTHTFTVVFIDGQYLYFEASYLKLRGIYYPTTLEDIFNYVITNMRQDNSFTGNYRIYSYDIPDNKYSGRTCLEFMTYVKNIGKKIPHVYSPKYTVPKLSKRDIAAESFSNASTELLDFFEIANEADNLYVYPVLDKEALENSIKINEYFRYSKAIATRPIAKDIILLKNAARGPINGNIGDIRFHNLANAILANPDKSNGNVKFMKRIDGLTEYYDIVTTVDIGKNSMLTYNATDDFPEFFNENRV